MNAKRCAFLILMCAFSLGCKSRNEQPELIDPIYLDIQRQIGDVVRAIDNEKKTLAEREETFASVVPQTGQIKYAQLRLFDSKNRLEKLHQQKQYLEFAMNSRAKTARRDYSIAYSQDKPWPDPSEYSNYKAIQTLQAKPLNWNVENRMREVGIKIPKKAPPKEGKAPASTEKPKSAE